ncbi:MAG: SDR family oxidoreductase [Candidatus Sulfotelmatobacter sp.]
MHDPSHPLRGNTALITGGAKRLGRASALALARAGADVAITFRDSSREAEQTVADLLGLGIRAFALRCDITDEASVRSMMNDAGRELGRIDILVNNAANYETAEFEELTVKQWDAMFASNTRGPFLVSREALPWMRRPRARNDSSKTGRRLANAFGKGTPSSRAVQEPSRRALAPGVLAPVESRIINMGSLGGLRPWATHAHYCSSKAALHMLTKVMAKALAPEIAVNAVAPGMIDLGEKSAAPFMRRMAKETPMQRNGRGEEIAAAVLFFATAPQFITGQILAVDGGIGL